MEEKLTIQSGMRYETFSLNLSAYPLPLSFGMLVIQWEREENQARQILVVPLPWLLTPPGANGMEVIEEG